MPLAQALRRDLYIRWTLVIAAMGLSVALFHLRGRPAQAGDIIRTPFTLLPGDRGCQCALDLDVPDHKCAYFRDEKERIHRSQVEGAGRWSPHWTTDRILYVVDGLFENPDVVRVAEERKSLPARDQRFVAKCRVKLVQWVSKGKVRFHPRAKWDPHLPDWQVKVVDCDVD